MQYFAYVRTSFWAKYCDAMEKSGQLYDRDAFMQSFLRDVGSPGLVTQLQTQLDPDMFECLVAVKPGWSVRLVNNDDYGK